MLFTERKRSLPTVTAVRDQHAAGAVDVKLNRHERAVLGALVGSGGRVIDRGQLRRDAGLEDLDARRCESALVGVRRALGPGAVVTVRRRGWRLHPDVMALAAAIIAAIG